MAKPGPKPKPTTLKRLAGNPGRRPLNEREPEPEQKAPSMPRGVLPKRAMKAWRDLSPQLEALGLLTAIDAPNFFLLCLWYGVAQDAAALIRAAEEAAGGDQGLVTTDDRGRERKNRALTILRAASTEIRMLASDFGMTPADRARVAGGVLDQEPTLAELLFDAVRQDAGDDL